ncbi:8802_t:CDS:2 [Ambispora leptoticha]|uniref:8802_t:CDS:1 n=1 Tax=Ambispora leptoticha TaxID=144679 RepID=A0A9N9EC06_9GLOM|nr:8802_t:CDS:2 [Ambispora leptoticha]
MSLSRASSISRLSSSVSRLSVTIERNKNKRSKKSNEREQFNQPDPSKRWIDFKDVFLRDAFKTVKRDVARYQVEDYHVLKIIKERHRHQREKYLKQQNSVLNNRVYHSDEPSETDEEAANEEHRLGIYNISEKEQDRHNHVVKVVDKKWRSSKLKEILMICEISFATKNTSKIKRRHWGSANVNSSASLPPRTLNGVFHAHTM